MDYTTCNMISLLGCVEKNWWEYDFISLFIDDVSDRDELE